MPAAKHIQPVVTRIANAAAKAATNEGAKIVKPFGLTRVLLVSPALKKFLGVGEISRTDTIKKLWMYVKDHGLQDPKNRREIVCDEKLKLVLGKERVHFTEVAGLLNVHFPKKEDKKS